MSKLIGKAPNQIPTNADLGSMAYQSTEYVTLEQMTITENSGLTLGGPKASQPRINFYNQYSTDGSTWWNITNEGNANRLSIRKYGQGPTVSIHDDANIGTLVIGSDSRILMGNNTDSTDSASYGITIKRKGNAGSPATFPTTYEGAALDYAPLYGQGPSSYVQHGDFLNASYGRIVTGDADVEKFALIDISYDSGLSPLRLDGKGNMWLGHNRASATTDSTRTHSLKAAGKVYATQGFNNGGVREYAQAISGIANNGTYTFDVPIQATGAGYTVYYECMYNHFGNTTYGAWRSGMFSFRSLSNSTYYDDNIINHGNSNAGSWSVTMVDAGTSSPKMRFTKSGGTYGGSGAGHIFVRGGLVE